MLYNCVVIFDIGFCIPLSWGKNLTWRESGPEGSCQESVPRQWEQAWTRSPMRPERGFVENGTRWGVKPSMLNASTAALHLIGESNAPYLRWVDNWESCWYEGAYPKERIPYEVKHINDPSMGIPDGVVCGTEDSDKWDKNERSWVE